MKNARILGILRCEEDLLCKSIEVLGETAYAVSLRTSLHTILAYHKTDFNFTFWFRTLRCGMPVRRICAICRAVPGYPLFLSPICQVTGLLLGSLTLPFKPHNTQILYLSLLWAYFFVKFVKIMCASLH